MPRHRVLFAIVALAVLLLALGQRHAAVTYVIPLGVALACLAWGELMVNGLVRRLHRRTGYTAPEARDASPRRATQAGLTRSLWARVALLIAFLAGARLWHGSNGGLVAALAAFAVYSLSGFVLGIRAGWNDRTPTSRRS